MAIKETQVIMSKKRKLSKSDIEAIKRLNILDGIKSIFYRGDYYTKEELIEIQKMDYKKQN